MASGALVQSVRPLVTLHPPVAPSAPAAPRISEEQVQQFEEDGATVLRGFFSSEWIEQLRVAAEENLKNPGPLCDESVKPGEPGRFHDDQFLWMRYEVMKRFIFESPAAEIARRMSRANQMRLLHDHLIVKEPGTQTTTPWHNDHSYWPLKGNQIISVWVALDYVPKSSCVQYVKGSHRWQLLHKQVSDHREAVFKESDLKELLPLAKIVRLNTFSGEAERYKAMADLPPAPDIDSMSDKVELLSWDLVPGDCLVHQSFSVHGAPGISSSASRVGDDVRWDPRPGTLDFSWRTKGNLDPNLSVGSPMDSDLFPVVARRS